MVVKLFFTDPTEKIKTIITFKHNIVSEEYLCDRNSMDSGLKHIINTILCKTKTYLQSLQEGEKEWGEALRLSYNGAVWEGVYPNPQMGSSLERDIATRLNLDSCNKNRSAVASLSVTQVQCSHGILWRTWTLFPTGSQRILCSEHGKTYCVHPFLD